jgi:hypothetical protein
MRVKRPSQKIPKLAARLEALQAALRRNTEALESCPGHAFQPESRWPRLYVCERCGGKIDGISWYWFRVGFETGRREHA